MAVTEEAVHPTRPSGVSATQHRGIAKQYVAVAIDALRTASAHVGAIASVEASIIEGTLAHLVTKCNAVKREL